MKIGKNPFTPQQIGIIFIFLCTFIVAFLLYFVQSQDSQQTTNPATVPTITPTNSSSTNQTNISGTTENPSETRPDSNYIWRGNENEPKYITISNAGISGYVQTVGITKNNEMGTPNNIYMAGWYKNSAIPGDIGLSIIDGHVNGRNVGNGIFYNLKNVQIGDIVIIKLGDGTEKTFKVYRNVSVDLAQANTQLFAKDANVTSQLNLITCSGTYDKSAQTYNQRVIVSASLIN